MPSPRAGFTLLELLLAITITGLVAVMALVVADVGLTSGEQVVRHRATSESQAQLRALLADALRHTVEGNGPVDTVFTVRRGLTRDGRSADTLIFRTRGIPPVLGGAHEWRVMVWPASSGLVLYAEATDAPLPALRTQLPEVGGFAVRALATADSVWTDGWDAPGRVPRAVEATVYDASGRPAGAPLVVRVGSAAVP